MVEAGSTTLESNYWFGAQGNRLWVGQVEGDGKVDITGKELKDKSASNRVKVRIMGYHAPSRKTLPPKDLPWAHTMMPVTAAHNRASGAVHNLDNGSWVLGTFLDGESAQQPLVLGNLGVVEKGQKYEDRVSELGGNQNYTARRPETLENNKPGGSENNGPANRGQDAGRSSNSDKEQKEAEKITYSLANGKCGKSPESDFARILNDLFKFVRKHDSVGGKLVNSLTGSVVNTGELAINYVNRLAAVVDGMLGNIKALVLAEMKKFLQEKIIQPALLAAAAIPQKKITAVNPIVKKFIDLFFELIKCLFDTIIDKVLNVLLDMVLGIIDNLINAAFCVVSDMVKAITGQITNAISGVLNMIKSAASIIKSGGDWAGSILNQIGDFIAAFCDGNLSCVLGIGEYTTGEGGKPDNVIESIFNRIETAGGLTDQLEVGLYGDDSFFRTFESTQFFDSDGKVARGTLDCSKANQIIWPSFPDMWMLGLPRLPFADLPRAVPAVNRNGRVTGGVITNPGIKGGLDRPPDITISSPNDYGSGGKAVAIINRDGQLGDILITRTGIGYPYFDKSVTNTKVPVDKNGDPLYDKIYGIDTENPFWLGIITPQNPPQVINAGFDLNERTCIKVKPGDDEVNEVVLPVLKPNIIDGRLISVEVVREGFGFTTLPKVYLAECRGEVELQTSNTRRARILPTVKFIPRKDAPKYLNFYDTYAHIIDCVGHPGE